MTKLIQKIVERRSRRHLHALMTAGMSHSQATLIIREAVGR